MYWKPTPTIYEQKRSEFMNKKVSLLSPKKKKKIMDKILIYFIVGNNIYWIHISMANTQHSSEWGNVKEREWREIFYN
jgi:hypothetical protein